MANICDEQRRLVLRGALVCRLDGVLRILYRRIDKQSIAFKRRDAPTSFGIRHHPVDFLGRVWQKVQASERFTLRSNYQDTTLAHGTSVSSVAQIPTKVPKLSQE